MEHYTKEIMGTHFHIDIGHDTLEMTCVFGSSTRNDRLEDLTKNFRQTFSYDYESPMVEASLQVIKANTFEEIS